MPINYIVKQKVDPRNLEAPKKYYAQPVSSGELTLRQLSERIENLSTVSSIDVIAVLEALLKIIPEKLSEGNIIRLGDFGSFYTTTQSNGADIVNFILKLPIFFNRKFPIFMKKIKNYHLLVHFLK